MLKHTYTKLFKKEYKLMKKRGLDMKKLDEIMGMIINEQPLPPRCRPHPLHGKWDGAIDCHIQGDWVLVYKPNPEARTVTFSRIGTHSDLDL